METQLLERDGEHTERGRKGETHRRTGDGDPQFGAGGGRIGLEPRHPAEQPQGDAVGHDAELPTDERVAHLVREE